MNKSNVALNESVTNDHEDFFWTVTHALFESFVVITYQLYERRRDTISLPTLIDDLAATDPTLAMRLKAVIDQQRPLLAKASAIRCGIYAHRNKAQPPEAIIAATGLLKSEMQSIVDMTKEIVASLAGTAGVNTREEIIKEIEDQAVCASDDTLLLMSALREHAH